MNKEEKNEYNPHGFGTTQGSIIISENIVMNGQQGHGFAAEKSNNMLDKIQGRDAKIIGGDNAKNGADRLVDGIKIQSKYCKTGLECINSCFDSTGEFRYISSDGQPMVIEVPSDKYEEALKAMAKKISEGQIKGISDPKKANDYVKKGQISYEQAKNIATAGNVDSIIFDSINGAVTTSATMGLSALISFSISVWNGESVEKATEKACYAGLGVGGVTFLSTVISSQIARTGAEQMLRGASNSIVNIIGKDGSSLIANAINGGKNIYGAAAANNLSKLLRGNIITSTVTTAILSSVDIYRLIDGKISGGQAFKNIMSIAVGVGGGTLGWIGGAALGAQAGAIVGTIVPGIGNIIGTGLGFLGGLAGSILGGSGATNITKKLLGQFIEDDFPKMLKLLEYYVKQVAESYLLQEKEIELLLLEIQMIEEIDKKMMELFKSEDKKEYSMQLLNPILKNILNKRVKIAPPDQMTLIQKIDEILLSNELFKLKEIPFYDSENATLEETIQLNEILEEYRNIYGVEGKKIDKIITESLLFRHERLIFLLQNINDNNSIISSESIIENLKRNFTIVEKQLLNICYKNIRNIFSLDNKELVKLVKQKNNDRMILIEDLVLEKTEECYEFAVDILKQYFKEEEEYVDKQIKKLSEDNIKILIKNIREKENGIEIIRGNLSNKLEKTLSYTNAYIKIELIEEILKNKI